MMRAQIYIDDTLGGEAASAVLASAEKVKNAGTKSTETENGETEVQKSQVQERKAPESGEDEQDESLENREREGAEEQSVEEQSVEEGKTEGGGLGENDEGTNSSLISSPSAYVPVTKGQMNVTNLFLGIIAVMLVAIAVTYIRRNWLNTVEEKSEATPSRKRGESRLSPEKKKTVEHQNEATEVGNSHEATVRTGETESVESHIYDSVNLYPVSKKPVQRTNKSSDAWSPQGNQFFSSRSFWREGAGSVQLSRNNSREADGYLEVSDSYKPGEQAKMIEDRGGKEVFQKYSDMTLEPADRLIGAVNTRGFFDNCRFSAVFHMMDSDGNSFDFTYERARILKVQSPAKLEQRGIYCFVRERGYLLMEEA